MTSARRLLRGLEERGLTLAVAESYTGGRLQDLLTNVPGSSAVFLGGIVAYDDKVKRQFLRVPAKLFRNHGAVSPEVASAMARGIRRRFQAHVGVSTTGIAGPSGETSTKPRGLSYVAVATARRVLVERRLLQGSRIQIKDRGAMQAIRLAHRVALAQPLRRPSGSRSS